MGDEPGTPDILYHYCSNATFLSIVESDSIRLSDLSLSNDSQEGRWVRKVFEEYCTSHGVARHHLDTALGDFDGLLGFIGAVGFCMSEREDALSQWRAYADDGYGMAIGFPTSNFCSLREAQSGESWGFTLNRIAYGAAEQQAAISKTASKIKWYIDNGSLKPQHLPLIGLSSDDEINKIKKLRNDMLFSYLFFLPDLYTIKNPAFSEEAEWRLISIFTGKEGPGSPGDLNSMNYRSLRDRIVPFRDLPLHHEGQSPIKRVVLGPRNITPISVVKGFLAKHGHEDVEVIPSTASYR